MNFTFSAAFMANMLSMTAMLILLSMAGQSHLAADLGIVQAATSALFLAFSANARSIVLATSSAALAKSLFNVRVVLLMPLVIVAFWLSSTLGGIEPAFVAVLILRRSVEWVGEVDLSERERLGDKNFAITYVLLQAVLFILAAVWLVMQLPYPLLGLLLWAIIPLLLSAKFSVTALGDFKHVVQSINKKLVPHFGSSLAIGVSFYVFRLLLILILGKSVSGDLFAAFAIGGVLGSVFVSAFGPSIAFNEKVKGSFKFPKMLQFLLWCFVIFGGGILSLSYLKPVLFSWSGKEIFYWQAIGFAMIGGVVMTHAQLLRNRLLIHNEKHDLFGPDLLMNMLVVAAIPLAYFSFGISAVAALSLVGAVLALMFYKSSEYTEIMKQADRSKLLNYVQYVTAFIILIPVFFKLDSGLFIAKEIPIISDSSLMALPVPLSVFLIYFALLIIGSYRTVHLSLSVVFFSFVLMIFTTLIISTNQGALEQEKILLIVQFLLPMIALVLGEMFRAEGMDDDAQIERTFLYILCSLVPLQLVTSWIQGSLSLVPYVYIFSIYQYLHYVPIIFVSSYLLVLFSLWPDNRYKLVLLILSPLMGVYAAASLSPVAIIILLSGLLVFSVLRLRLASDKQSASLSMFVIFVCMAYLSIEIATMPVMSKLVLYNFEILSSWQLYLADIFESVKSLFLGHVNVLDKSKFPSTHNYYLDMIRNFGLIAIFPILIALGYTLKLVYSVRKVILENSAITGHLLVIFLLLLLDNSIQVSLRQPYSGIFTFFLWGLLLARLHKMNVLDSKS